MSRKQIAIYILCLVLAVAFGYDYNQEAANKIQSKIEEAENNSATQRHGNWNFDQLDPVHRLAILSENRYLSSGTYVVGETKDNKGNVYVTPGTYNIKNENLNNKASFLINDNEYILGNAARSVILANYVEVQLKQGDKLIIKNDLLVKATRVIGGSDEN